MAVPVAIAVVAMIVTAVAIAMDQRLQSRARTGRSPVPRGGDQFVTVNIVVPTKLSKEQRQAFENLAKVCEDDDLVQERNIFDKVKDIFG